MNNADKSNTVYPPSSLFLDEQGARVRRRYVRAVIRSTVATVRNWGRGRQGRKASAMTTRVDCNRIGESHKYVQQPI